MADPIKDGGFAFPWGEHGTRLGGMSMRDYFAIQTLPAIYSQAMVEAREGSGLFIHEDWRVGLALDAYAMADAMLRAREISNG